jgi:excisionase family DNA binding protein
MAHLTSPSLISTLTDEELLDHYLSLTPRRRQESFIDTARAAEITGVSVRTIQLWVDVGAVRALAIGGRYRVVVESLKGYLKRKMNMRQS